MAALILPQSASLLYARVLLRLGELVEPYIAAGSLVDGSGTTEPRNRAHGGRPAGTQRHAAG
eukprot:370876-Prymnesium_polylepis.1